MFERRSNGRTLGPPTLAHAQLNESPITPGFWSFPAKRLKLQKMPLLPVATTSKFGLPMATLSVFRCKELSGVESSDMSLRSAGARLVARRRSKSVR